VVDLRRRRAVDGVKWSKDMREQLKNHAARRRLADRPRFLPVEKITFVLDAMLGVVNLEQNNIIKLFLGDGRGPDAADPDRLDLRHEFKVMQELEWVHGYPMALVMMLARAVLPYVLFKWKKWL